MKTIAILQALSALILLVGAIHRIFIGMYTDALWAIGTALLFTGLSLYFWRRANEWNEQ